MSPRPWSRSSRSYHSSSGVRSCATSSISACRSPRSANRGGHRPHGEVARVGVGQLVPRPAARTPGRAAAAGRSRPRRSCGRARSGCSRRRSLSPRSSFHHLVVTLPGIRRSSSRPNAIAACRTSVNVQRGCDPHVDVHAAVAGGLGEAAPAELAEHLPGDAGHGTAASRKSVPGWGSRSIRSSSGLSTSGRRTGQGWKVMVFCWAHQATVASSVGQTSSAVRPLGNAMCAVSTQSGAPLLIRFW